MIKDLNDRITKVLGEAGVDLQSKGYGYLLEAITLLIEQEGYIA